MTWKSISPVSPRRIEEVLDDLLIGSWDLEVMKPAEGGGEHANVY